MDVDLRPDVMQALTGLNSWWQSPHDVKPVPLPYRRRSVRAILAGLGRSGAGSLVHVLRGPRQVGKTTALYQLAADLISAGMKPTEIFLARFDLQPIREAGSILSLANWFARKVRRKPLGDGRPPVFLLDEVHKLDRWDEQVKHLFDTFGVRIVLTGSSSILVLRGQRESLAGRAITVDFPPFLFREVLEAWSPKLLGSLPAPLRFTDLFLPSFDPVAHFGRIHKRPPARVRLLRAGLDRYFYRGGYPRPHSGEIDDDRWADYLSETVFERVLGVDIPDMYPVEQPSLLRHVYFEVARRTGFEISQSGLAEDCNAAGYRTNQPVVGRYLRYLVDAQLAREFRRYPLARGKTARVPVKMTLTDLGVRNAIFRGAPSLWDSPADVVAPLVETLVQTVVRGVGLQAHFYRDYTEPGNRRSPIEEVDFVAEALDGTTIPIEVKFRKHVGAKDERAIRRFRERFPGPFGLVITRDTFRADPGDPIICLPLLDFLLAF